MYGSSGGGTVTPRYSGNFYLLRVAVSALCAVAAVFLLRRLSLGKLGNLIVHTLIE